MLSHFREKRFLREKMLSSFSLRLSSPNLTSSLASPPEDFRSTPIAATTDAAAALALAAATGTARELGAQLVSSGVELGAQPAASSTQLKAAGIVTVSKELEDAFSYAEAGTPSSLSQKPVHPKLLDNQQMLLAGWLPKRPVKKTGAKWGRGIKRAGWHRRWLVLRTTHISWQESPSGPTRGRLTLDPRTSVEQYFDEPERPHALQVFSVGQELTLQASSDEECLRWIESIEAQVRRIAELEANLLEHSDIAAATVVVGGEITARSALNERQLDALQSRRGTPSARRGSANTRAMVGLFSIDKLEELEAKVGRLEREKVEAEGRLLSGKEQEELLGQELKRAHDMATFREHEAAQALAAEKAKAAEHAAALLAREGGLSAVREKANQLRKKSARASGAHHSRTASQGRTTSQSRRSTGTDVLDSVPRLLARLAELETRLRKGDSSGEEQVSMQQELARLRAENNQLKLLSGGGGMSADDDEQIMSLYMERLGEVLAMRHEGRFDTPLPGSGL